MHRVCVMLYFCVMNVCMACACGMHNVCIFVCGISVLYACGCLV